MKDTIEKINNKGEKQADIAIAVTLLEREKGDQAIYESVNAYLTNKRVQIACTKTRSEVKATGKKPFKQKGTGRARAGSKVSPIWRGGGIAFGPRPRTFSKKVNKKVRHLAIKRAFTLRVDRGDVIAIDDVVIAEAKTKLLASFLKDIKVCNRTLIILDKGNENFDTVLIASKNIPDLKVVNCCEVNSYDLSNFKKIVITEKAINLLNNRLNKGDDNE